MKRKSKAMPAGEEKPKPAPHCLHELAPRADGLYECKRCRRLGRRKPTGWIEWIDQPKAIEPKPNPQIQKDPRP